MNALLLEACNFAQYEGEGIKCRTSLQMNEFKLFATSIKFLNTTALTHLSYNVVPNDVVDLLFCPGIKRETLMYLNRIRIVNIKDNDEKVKEIEAEESELKSQDVSKSKKKKAFLKNAELKKGKLMDSENESGLKNLWGQATNKAKERQEALKEKKLLHCSLHEQINRIVTEAPRIEHFGMKWRDHRKDETNHKINTAFIQLKQLTLLRTLYIGVCTFDYVHLVNNLPPYLEELTLRTTFCSSYKEPKQPVSAAAAAAIADKDKSTSNKKNKSNKKQPGGNSKKKRLATDFDSDDDTWESASDDDSDSDEIRHTRRKQKGSRAGKANRLAPSPTFPRFLKAIKEHLPRLKLLRMHDAEINGECNFSELNGHKNLSTIIIHSNDRFSKRSFDASSIPHNVRYFRLSNCSLRGELDFSKFPPELIHLDLSDNQFKGPNKSYVDLSSLATSLRNLEVLILDDCSYLKLHADSLENLPIHLQDLDIRDTYSTGSLQFSKLPANLARLGISGNHHSTESPMSTACERLGDAPATLRCLEISRIQFDTSVSHWNWNLLPPLLEKFVMAGCSVSQAPRRFDDESMASCRGLNLATLPCVDTIQILNFTTCTGFNDELSIIISCKAKKLKSLNLSSSAYKDIQFVDENGDPFKNPQQEMNKRNVFPQSLQVLNISSKGPPHVSRELFSLSLLPDSLQQFNASKSYYKGVPDFTNLPIDLRTLRLNDNMFTSPPDKTAPIRLDCLPPRLKLIDLSKNKFAGSPIILKNVGSHLRTIDMRNNKFDITNSQFDTSNATRMKHIIIPGVSWDKKQTLVAAAMAGKTNYQKSRVRRGYDSDGSSDFTESHDSWDSSLESQDDSDEDDEGYSVKNVFGNDLQTGWPVVWESCDEKYGDYNDTSQGSDYDHEDEWTDEYTADSDDDDSDDSWGDSDSDYDDDDSDENNWGGDDGGWSTSDSW